MPRSQQSREGSIVQYFASADLAIAQVVMRLSQDALRARLVRSAEAKDRAAHAQKQAERAAGKAAGAGAAGKSNGSGKVKRKRRTKAQMQAAAGMNEAAEA